MKCVKCFLACLLILPFGLAGCDNENEATKNARRAIVGTWRYVNGMTLSKTSTHYLHFDKNGQQQFERYVGEEGYYSHSSPYIFEDDWEYLNGSKLRGHIRFNTYQDHLSSELQRYLCSIDGEKLVVLPDMGEQYIMDPTMYFERINTDQ